MKSNLFTNGEGKGFEKKKLLGHPHWGEKQREYKELILCKSRHWTTIVIYGEFSEFIYIL